MLQRKLLPLSSTPNLGDQMICFIIPMYTNMAWNPADVDFFTLTGNIIMTIQYIQDVWMINIYIMKRLSDPLFDQIFKARVSFISNLLYTAEHI